MLQLILQNWMAIAAALGAILLAVGDLLEVFHSQYESKIKALAQFLLGLKK